MPEHDEDIKQDRHVTNKGLCNTKTKIEIKNYLYFWLLFNFNETQIWLAKISFIAQ